MKIAILTTGNSSDTGGIMSFVCEEARQLNQKGLTNMAFDVFMIRLRHSLLLSLILRCLKGVEHKMPVDYGKKITIVDGVTFHNLWIKENLVSFFIRTRITYRPFGMANTRKIVKNLISYDYVLTHKYESQYIGLQMKKKYGIPFGAFWHGSELTIRTFSNKHAYSLSKEVLEKANDNFFVSKALLKIGKSVFGNGNNHVIYTGPSDMFYRYDAEQKKELRAKNRVQEDEIVVAYVGSLISVKNVLAIPSIFRAIKDKCPNNKIKFWIIGSGDLEAELQFELKKQEVSYDMLGKIPQNKMPDYMNCIDILLLISKKEGLGLVCLEAMKCGAQVFGSLVGGIPEVIGEDRCVPLDDKFVDDISDMVSCSIQRGKVHQNYDEKFSWNSAIDSILVAITH